MLLLDIYHYKFSLMVLSWLVHAAAVRCHFGSARWNRVNTQILLPCMYSGERPALISLSCSLALSLSRSLALSLSRSLALSLSCTDTLLDTFPQPFTCLPSTPARR
jgi:hypothetical protein